MKEQNFGNSSMSVMLTKLSFWLNYLMMPRYGHVVTTKRIHIETRKQTNERDQMQDNTQYTTKDDVIGYVGYKGGDTTTTRQKLTSTPSMW